MKKKRIALIADADNWAYANIAKNIVDNIGEEYDFEIIYSQYYDDELPKIFLLCKDFDLIHFFWRGMLLGSSFPSYKYYVETLGYSLEGFNEKYVNNKIITTSVYDHLYIGEDDLEKTNYILDHCNNYYVSSNRLYKVYKNLNLQKLPKCVITDGVDLLKFYPINIDRFKNIKKRNLVIGWVGNSVWQDKDEDIKGFNTIIKPAIKELQDEGYPIDIYFADRQERMIPHYKMVNYYSKIDLYVCCSKIEGTPNPILESMACGVPIITTDVGIVPDVFGEKQKKFIMQERTKECLKGNIKYLLENIDTLKELSDENLEMIKNWSWNIITSKFKKFFDDVFKENK